MSARTSSCGLVYSPSLTQMQEKDRLLISCPNACSADDAAVLHGSGQFAASSPPCLAAAKIGLGSEGLLLRMTRGPPYGRGYEILGPSLQLTEDVVRFQQTDAKCLPFTWRSLFTDSMVHPLSFFADVDFRDRPSDDPSWRQSGRKLLLPFRPGLPDRLPHALLLKGQAGCPVRSAELTFSVKSEGTSGGLVFGVSKDAKDFAYAEILSEAGQVGSLDLMHRKDSKTYRLGETVKVQLPFEKPTKLAVAVKPGEKYWDLDVLLDERPVYRLQVPATALESMGRGRVGFGGSSTSSGFYVEDFNVTYA
ncbi:MAG: uncharacterized protein KVP18_000345 [Porospora cf. gigantea A]|uniref:uncharacterized protein n=1 Tax=Porospora cf. gigantea A TaxID=2853593 RepID=UPI003559600D|nr:MAG: hypothetical protein KVP18_000345 [Porospora cf. gigantea A]